MRLLSMVLLTALILGGCSESTEPPPEPPVDPYAVNLWRVDFLWAGRPLDAASGAKLAAADRADAVRWFLPKDRVPARWLDPSLTGAARDETAPVLEIYLRDDAGAWSAAAWGGITRGFGPEGRDLRGTEYAEIWVNDGFANPSDRHGRLHIDLGTIDEDGFWPWTPGADTLVTGRWEREDDPIRPADGIFSIVEDIGLDGLGCDGPQKFSPDYNTDDDPYPFINGTACNMRPDTEDVDGDGTFNRTDAYAEAVIDLGDTTAVVDVRRDYTDLGTMPDNQAWRFYRIPLTDFATPAGVSSPDWSAVHHLRLWYDDPAGAESPVVRLQVAGLRIAAMPLPD